MLLGSDTLFPSVDQVGTMRFGNLLGFFIIISAAAISAVKSSAKNGDLDENSVTALAKIMNEKFQELFQRLSKMELKMEKILEQQNERTGPSLENQIEKVVGGNPDKLKNTGGHIHESLMRAQLNASSAQVDRLETTLSQRKYDLKLLSK